MSEPELLRIWSFYTPYDPRILSCTRTGLKQAAVAWLDEVGRFSTPGDRRELAGVWGTKDEHLARMMSHVAQNIVPVSNVWRLLSLLDQAIWTDPLGVTRDTIAGYVARYVHFEVFAPEVLLNMSANEEPAPQWWVEAHADETEAPPMHVTRVVEHIIRRRLTHHLATPADDLVVNCGAMWDFPFWGDGDPPMWGYYQVRRRKVDDE